MKRMRDVLEELFPGPLTSGQIINALRKSQELTLKDVERMTKLSEQRLSALENDKSSLTSRNAKKIAAALGVNPRTILFPNGEDYKDEEILKIEKIRDKILREKRFLIKSLQLFFNR